MATQVGRLLDARSLGSVIGGDDEYGGGDVDAGSYDDAGGYDESGDDDSGGDDAGSYDAAGDDDDGADYTDDAGADDDGSGYDAGAEDSFESAEDDASGAEDPFESAEDDETSEDDPFESADEADSSADDHPSPEEPSSSASDDTTATQQESAPDTAAQPLPGGRIEDELGRPIGFRSSDGRYEFIQNNNDPDGRMAPTVVRNNADGSQTITSWNDPDATRARAEFMQYRGSPLWIPEQEGSGGGGGGATRHPASDWGPEDGAILTNPRPRPRPRAE